VKITQSQIADALTHVEQIIILCLAAGTSAQVESYFSAEIVHGQTIVSFTEQVNMMGCLQRFKN